MAWSETTPGSAINPGVLFKLPVSALDNRPLEFVVTDQLQNKGRVSLDV